MQKTFVLLAACVALGICGLSLQTVQSQPPRPVTPPNAEGVVYFDANHNGVFDGDDEPLPGIRVSNGRQIVTTDADGRYTLPIDGDTILFVIKPRGWRTPLSDDMLPRFYYIHKPNGSPDAKYSGVEPTGPLPESVDFPLYPQKEPDQFHALLFGDPQPRNQKEVDYVAHDVVEDLIGTDASFGVTLGDIAFDNLDTFQPQNRAIALLGIPWYNVLGNHDINFDAQTRRHANETFERVFGPSYYSFDYGPVHFLVLDDIEWIYDENTGKGRYQGGFGPEQLEFIRTDLQQIPEDQLVVLFMHIPLTGVEDRHGLYRLIEQRPFCMSVSAHAHVHEHRFITHEDGWEGPQPHHHVINVTVSGSWWSGAPDERGIPHTLMADGAPNGYSIISFDGHDYSLEFRAAGRPDDYQMHIVAPEVVSAADAESTVVWVNVFNGSSRSRVEMRLGSGEWITMEHTRDIDPNYRAVTEREAQLLEAQPGAFLKLTDPKESSHLWKAHLPASPDPGTYRLHVRTTDMFGRTHEDARVIRIE
ncbi:MAG: metallophosphoesterase [Planctomycetota bacterium]|nr:MAG: metallophosphoesterase [Planctomycetota bacterium]REK29317.1 MAG: metallophosphoesterase [Planctomycetota bacterium]REK35948.1 MAG: metallophosphoesterase [Planctomycetota bacterium]